MLRSKNYTRNQVENISIMLCTIQPRDDNDDHDDMSMT